MHILDQSFILGFYPVGNGRVISVQAFLGGWEFEIRVSISILTICFLSLFRLFSCLSRSHTCRGGSDLFCLFSSASHQLITAIIALSNCLVVPGLHVVNMSLSDKLIQQSVSLLVTYLVLNRYQSILEIHNRIFKLHGTLCHVCLLPSCLYKFLLSFYFGFRDIFRRRFHVLDDLSLSFLQFSQVLILLLSNHCLQLLQVVSLWSKLISIEMVVSAHFIIVWIMSPICFGKSSSGLLSLVEALLKLFIQVKNRESKIIPEFRIASERV